MINNEILKMAVEKIKELGYQVYIPNDSEPHLYAHYTDGKNIAYIQVEYFGRGIEITTVHKPNKISGEGYQISGNDEAIDPKNLTIELLNKGFLALPYWARNDKLPNKYTLLEWLETTWSGKRAKLI